MDAERIDHVTSTLRGLVDKKFSERISAGDFQLDLKVMQAALDQFEHVFLSFSSNPAPGTDFPIFQIALSRAAQPGIKPNRMETVVGANTTEGLGHCLWLLQTAQGFYEENREKAFRWVYWVIGYTDKQLGRWQQDTGMKIMAQALSVCMLYLSLARGVTNPTIRSNINCYVEGVLAFFDLMTIEEAKRLHMPEGENFDAKRK